MPPRRSSRKTKQSSSSTAAAPAPKRNTRSSKAKAKADVDVDVVEAEDVVEEPTQPETTTGTVKELVEETVKSVAESVKDVAEGAKDFVEEMNNMKVVEEIGEGREEGEKQAQGGIESQSQREAEDEPMSLDQEPQTEAGQKEKDPAANLNGDGDGEPRQPQPTTTMTTTTTGMSLEERKKKLDELRNRMRDSTRQNLSALRGESTKTKASFREAARREKQLRLVETLRLKAEAEERGEDVERKRNWEWTVEENEEWERKRRRKERNADFEFHDEEQAARKRYKKDLAFLKPDLETYNKQKQLALGGGGGGTPGSSTSTSTSISTSKALTTFDSSGGAGQVTSYEQQRAAESLYRDANTLLYADNKPSEDAIDRVVEKLNLEQDKRNKFSRKRLNEDEGDITYINERNRVFNKKIARYYDKYTTEIRASFERGTAL